MSKGIRNKNSTLLHDDHEDYVQEKLENGKNRKKSKKAIRQAKSIRYEGDHGEPVEFRQHPSGRSESDDYLVIAVHKKSRS